MAKVTAEDLKGWYTPAEVRELAQRTGLSQSEAGTTVWKLVSGDLIRCVASHASMRTSGGKTAASERATAVTADDLAHLTKSAKYDFWAGRLEFLVSDGSGYSGTYAVTTLFNVRLDPADVHKHFPKLEPPAAETTEPADAPKGGAGGRPRATWREPVLIELAGQMLDGDLQPKKLADLENAAMEWLGKQGEYPSERLVRDVVRPLWLRFMQEGKNTKG